MTSEPLLVAPCSHEAARYAVERWHYSRMLPAGKTVRLGVWEHGRYIGCVIFSRGGTYHLATQWGLGPTEACELTRVALRGHERPVSQIVARALAHLRDTNPGLRLVISFADTEHGHHGCIYQAGNWIYTGRGDPTPEFIIHGQRWHARSVHAKGWKQTRAWLRAHIDPNAENYRAPGKHRYLYPLDRAMRRQLAKHAKPYPPPQ